MGFSLPECGRRVPKYPSLEDYDNGIPDDCEWRDHAGIYVDRVGFPYSGSRKVIKPPRKEPRRKARKKPSVTKVINAEQGSELTTPPSVNEMPNRSPENEATDTPVPATASPEPERGTSVRGRTVREVFGVTHSHIGSDIDSGLNVARAHRIKQSTHKTPVCLIPANWSGDGLKRRDICVDIEPN